MTLRFDGDDCHLSSGKVLRVINRQIFGIMRWNDGLHDGLHVLTSGYDDVVHEDCYGEQGADLSDADRIEIADYMIARWQTYRADILNRQKP